MTITNTMYYGVDGSVLYGDDLNSIQSFALSNMIKYGLDNTSTNQVNYFEDGFTSATYINTGATTALYNYFSTGGTVYFCDILDDFEDGSLDATIWSSGGTGSISETGGYVYLKARYGASQETAYIKSDGGINAFDFFAVAADTEVVFDVVISLDSGNAGTFQPQVIGGGGTVNLGAAISSSTTLTLYRYAFLYDHSGTTVDVFRNGVLIADDVDISSCGGNAYLNFLVTSGASSAGYTNAYILGIGYLDGSAGSSLFQTATRTTDVTAGTGIITNIYGLTPVTETIQASFDTGGNYTTISDSILYNSSNTGTGWIYKTTVTHPTTISTTTPVIPNIRKYGAYYSD
jgi:hypothetical protein